jgi:hypothetical protein
MLRLEPAISSVGQSAAMPSSYVKTIASGLPYQGPLTTEIQPTVYLIPPHSCRFTAEYLIRNPLRQPASVLINIRESLLYLAGKEVN